MLARAFLCLFALFARYPVLSWGYPGLPASGPPKARDFAHKTFEIGAPAAAKDAPLDRSYFLFHAGDSATYRRTRGTTRLRDSPLGWRLVGDSLHLRPGPVTIEAAGRTQRFARAALHYAVVPVAGGYLLRRKGEELQLREVK